MLRYAYYYTYNLAHAIYVGITSNGLNPAQNIIDDPAQNIIDDLPSNYFLDLYDANRIIDVLKIIVFLYKDMS